MPIRRQLQQALRALEFANADDLHQLQAMLESREADSTPPQRKAMDIEAARRQADAFLVSIRRMAQAAGHH